MELPVLPARGCNCATCPLYKHNPNATEPMCSGRNSSCSWCSCSVSNVHLPAGKVEAGSDCASCPVRCGSRPDMNTWVADAGGTFEFDDIYLSQFDWPLTTRFVPLLNAADTGQMHDRMSWPAFGVTIRRVVSRRPGTSGPLKLQTRWANQGAHQALQLEPGRQQVVLAGYGPDRIIERLWSRRHTDGLLDQIAAAGWDLVCTPDWSVYANQPRAEQLFNMRRSLVFAQELSERGVNVAPAIYSYRAEDLDRWCNWIADTNPTAVFLPRHTIKGNDEWRTLSAPALQLMAARMRLEQVDTRVVVTGVSNRERVADLVAWFGDRLTLATQLPQQLAVKGHRITDQGRVRSRADRADLFAANVRYYARQMDGRTARAAANTAA